MSAKQPKRVTAADERPPAPWGKFPLAELVILAGIVALVVGVVGSNQMLIGVGVVLAGLGGLEVAVREHFAGYRSHTTLLAGFPAVVVAVALFYAGDQIIAVCLAAGAAIFAVAFYLARRAFQRASGGLSFRIGGMRG
ncbi:MAG: hypothetical protein QOE75_2434 [Solirubrobacterales bacterium]|nr:hypothetical protein [Solirubrobacterales bacterium]